MDPIWDCFGSMGVQGDFSPHDFDLVCKLDTFSMEGTEVQDEIGRVKQKLIRSFMLKGLWQG